MKKRCTAHLSIPIKTVLPLKLRYKTLPPVQLCLPPCYAEAKNCESLWKSWRSRSETASKKMMKAAEPIVLRTCWVPTEVIIFFNHSTTPATAGASKTSNGCSTSSQQDRLNHCCCCDSCVFVLLFFIPTCLRVSKEFHEMHAEARSNSLKVFSEHEAALWWHPLYAVFFPRGFGSWQLQKPRPNPRPRLNPRPRPKHCLGPLVPPSPAWTCRRPTRQGLRHQVVAQHPPGP